MERIKYLDPKVLGCSLMKVTFSSTCSHTRRPTAIISTIYNFTLSSVSRVNSHSGRSDSTALITEPKEIPDKLRMDRAKLGSILAQTTLIFILSLLSLSRLSSSSVSSEDVARTMGVCLPHYTFLFRAKDTNFSEIHLSSTWTSPTMQMSMHIFMAKTSQDLAICPVALRRLRQR